MEADNTTSFLDLADTNLLSLIRELPECRQSAICFFISGDPDVIPSEIFAESPSKEVSLRMFEDGSILLVHEDIAYPYYTFEDFTRDRPRAIGRLSRKRYFKDFIKMLANFSK